MQRKGQFVVCPVKFTAYTIVAVFHLSEDLLKGYFFEKAALEVKHFVNPSKFDKSFEGGNSVSYRSNFTRPGY